MVPGDPLPDDLEILPEPDVLLEDLDGKEDRCSVALDQEGVHTDTFSELAKLANEEAQRERFAL